MSIDRKAAIREFKERTPSRGIFAIRCDASGRAWVGASPNLQAAENSLFFALRHASHRERSLQDEWTARGESAFHFDVVETLDEDTSPMLVNDLLKAKQREWVERLGARALLR
jgi:hypothetical protein